MPAKPCAIVTFVVDREEIIVHIPDGYLSPSTCAVMYAAAAPFWIIALRKVKRLLTTRLVPLIAVFAAFDFVVMMFNLPLPGGTTGHTVGMGITTVALGPWASILAISVALLIQALFFGDGGITAYGANCFNMAIVGSLVSFVMYRAFAGKTALSSSLRVFAAAAAGYTAINVSALCAAIEFGIQPALFKDANGAPLYAPYPLIISIPAMLIGHLTFAGLAELILSGGVVAYLQRSDPSLLKLTAPGASSGDMADGALAGRSGWRAARPLWIGVALLMVFTPLGLLAAGSAWGEWGPQDFRNPVARRAIAIASGNQAPPARPPRGFEQLSSLWTAPLPDYAPRFMKSEKLGYVLSAAFGTGLILLVFLAVARVAETIGRSGQLRGNGSGDE